MKFHIHPINAIDDPNLESGIRKKLDNKTKPIGSLGRIEALALQIGMILGTDSPQLQEPQLVVFAADHGLASRGVSAFPSDVTWQMVENFLAGGAAVSVLAKKQGLALTIVDCGVKHDFQPRDGLLIRKIGRGTADSLEAAAMSSHECEKALANGAEIVSNLPGNVILLGEMGIGNTSAASLILSRLSGVDIAECTGAGTGLDSAAIDRKIAILRQVLTVHKDAERPLEVLMAFGGFEIATMVGAVLQAALNRKVIVVDGFITGAAVLVAAALEPNVLQRCVFAHQSGERGHKLMLAQLKASPLLDLGLRLGEGSGGALSWSLLEHACVLLCDMASFESAGVSNRS